jgi:hypothetical protein
VRTSAKLFMGCLVVSFHHFRASGREQPHAPDLARCRNWTDG